MRFKLRIGTEFSREKVKYNFLIAIYPVMFVFFDNKLTSRERPASTPAQGSKRANCLRPCNELLYGNTIFRPLFHGFIHIATANLKTHERTLNLTYHSFANSEQLKNSLFKRVVPWWNALPEN